MKKKDQLKILAGKRVREARESLGMKQTELARYFGMRHPSKLNNWEQGLNLFPLENALQFQKLLRDRLGVLVPLDNFYGGLVS